MTVQAWQTIGVIVAILVGVVGTIYTARSWSRDQAKARATEIKDAETRGEDRVRDQLAEANRVIARRDRTIEIRDARINELEDKLYGRGPKP